MHNIEALLTSFILSALFDEKSCAQHAGVSSRKQVLQVDS